VTLYRRIVVGLDLDAEGRISEGAALALEQARWLGRRGGVRTTLLHSTRRDERWDAREADYVVDGGPRVRRGEERLEEALEALRAAGTEARLVLTEEPAWLAIVREVLREPADLVLTGKRSSRDHDARPVGSVALKLLRKCPCPVWVLKPDAFAPPRSLLAATDLGPVGEAVVFTAGRLAQEAGATLHVVHALQLPLAVQVEGEAATQQWLARAREGAEQTLATQLREAGRAADADRIHVGLTSPTRAVLAGVERLAPDLVVMGTISRGGVAGLLVGNTAERLLGRLDRSILAVKPADFVCPVEP